MNIRSAIEEVLYYAGDATLLPCVPVQLEHALSTLRAWLDAQPEAPTERWEPVADMSKEEFRNPDAWLAGNICICHRVEVKP